VDEIRDRVAKSIRTLREKQGLTLDELAARARTSRGYLWEVEKAKKTPSLEVLETLAAALEVRVRDLLEEPARPARAKKNPPSGTPEWLGSAVEGLAQGAPTAEVTRFRGLAAEFFAPYRRKDRTRGK
jgi:transcriptional regulator with XRE-family HTH domain